ncbi:unnamed protein product, partial [Mesorhabditis spiculigera]
MTNDISAKFQEHEVVPRVIDAAPAKELQVSYDSGVKAELGNVLTPTQVQNPPQVSWEAEADALYTLLLTDPDAPSRKEGKLEWHHWLVANIPGNKVSEGEVLSAYVGAGPPPNTGLHRYVFLLWKQPGKLSDAEHGHLTNTSPAKRDGFEARAFAKKHNLGQPIAGNFFQAEHDDYVPKLYKQLGF